VDLIDCVLSLGRRFGSRSLGRCDVFQFSAPVLFESCLLFAREPRLAFLARNKPTAYNCTGNPIGPRTDFDVPSESTPRRLRKREDRFDSTESRLSLWTIYESKSYIGGRVDEVEGRESLGQPTLRQRRV